MVRRGDVYTLTLSMRKLLRRSRRIQHRKRLSKCETMTNRWSKNCGSIHLAMLVFVGPGICGLCEPRREQENAKAALAYDGGNIGVTDGGWDEELADDEFEVVAAKTGPRIGGNLTGCPEEGEE